MSERVYSVKNLFLQLFLCPKLYIMQLFTLQSPFSLSTLNSKRRATFCQKRREFSLDTSNFATHQFEEELIRSGEFAQEMYRKICIFTLEQPVFFHAICSRLLNRLFFSQMWREIVCNPHISFYQIESLAHEKPNLIPSPNLSLNSLECTKWGSASNCQIKRKAQTLGIDCEKDGRKDNSFRSGIFMQRA
jgi:hypothetical protein